MGKIEISEKIKDEFWYKILSLIFGISLLFIGIKDRGVLKLVLGVLLIFYYTYHKSIYLSESGLIYTYKGFLFKRSERIDFQDIEEITIVKQRNNSIIFFIKEPMAKKIVVNNEKIEEIIKFIKRKAGIPINFES